MFQIRQVTATSTNLKTYFLNALEQVAWQPGLEDVECFLACDPTGLYVGELDGRPIATISMLKYEDGFCVFGCYTVEKEFRNRGYGRRLYDAVFKASSPTKLASYAVPEMAMKYKEAYGSERLWTVVRYDLSLPEVITSLQRNPARQHVEIKRPEDVDQQLLYSYDTAVFGYKRHNFLQKWLHAKGSHSRVAIDDGCVVGYLAVRVAANKDEGYRIGPLFCENMEVAKALLIETLEGVMERGMSTSQSIHIDCPETNEEAKELITLLKGRYIRHTEFTCSNGPPKGRFHNWFAVTSFESG